MPSNLKIAQSRPARPLGDILNGIRSARVKEHPGKLPTAIAARVRSSPYNSVLVPYLARVAASQLAKQHLTDLQRRIVIALQPSRVLQRAPGRYAGLPEEVRNAFDHKILDNKTSLSDVDKIMVEKLGLGLESLKNETQKAQLENREQVTLVGAFGTTSFNTASLKRWLDSLPPPPPKEYSFSLRYNGISTYKADEEPWRGGVDPYALAWFMRNPAGSPNLQQMISPFKIKHEPHDLHSMNSNEWSPSGGGQDNMGYPTNPVYIFTSPPMLRGDERYVAMLSVYEEDDNQAQQIMEQLGPLMISAGESIIAEMPYAAAALVVVGAALDLIAFFTTSEDDPVGNIMLLFDKNDLDFPDPTTWRSVTADVEATKNDNRWRLWFGVNSSKTT